MCVQKISFNFHRLIFYFLRNRRPPRFCTLRRPVEIWQISFRKNWKIQSRNMFRWQIVIKMSSPTWYKFIIIFFTCWHRVVCNPTPLITNHLLKHTTLYWHRLQAINKYLLDYQVTKWLKSWVIYKITSIISTPVDFLRMLEFCGKDLFSGTRSYELALIETVHTKIPTHAL